tara:strand:+ start:642 stop:1037 length:396 start_codon:yes stop_codon:yes gene_type:complete
VSLIARHFEAAGLPTVILGSALDIMTTGRPPRAAFLDYPLGHESGRPFDPADQRSVVRQALGLLHALEAPAIVPLANAWPKGWDAVREESRKTEGSDLRSPRDETPRYQTPEDEALAKRLGAVAPTVRRAT